MVNELGTCRNKKRIEDEPHGHVPSDRESEGEQCLLGLNEKGGDVILKDARVDW